MQIIYLLNFTYKLYCNLYAYSCLYKNCIVHFLARKKKKIKIPTKDKKK